MFCRFKLELGNSRPRFTLTVDDANSGEVVDPDTGLFAQLQVADSETAQPHDLGRHGVHGDGVGPRHHQVADPRTARLGTVSLERNGGIENAERRTQDTRQVAQNLIDLYEAWNKPEEAEEWRTKLPKSEALKE